MYSVMSVGSNTQLAGATEPTNKPDAVSEWNSILNFLFQIEAPAEEEPESAGTEPAESGGDSTAATETSTLWTGLMLSGATLPLSTIATAHKPQIEVDTSLKSPARGTNQEDYPVDAQFHPSDHFADSLGLAPLQGTNGPPQTNPTTTAAQVLPPKMTPPISASARQSNVSDTGSRPAGPGPTIASPPSLWTGKPATIDAAFRLDQIASCGGITLPKHLYASVSRDDVADILGVGSLPPAKHGTSFVLGHQPNQDASWQSEPKSHEDGSAGKGSKSPYEAAEVARSDVQQNPTDHGLFPAIVGGPNEPTRATQLEQQSSPSQRTQEVTAPTSVDVGQDKRGGPIHIELRLSPEDFGAPITGKETEVRLHLQQRGEEVLMKVFGGGEQLALRAEPEWDSLLKRLKLHGLEPTARAFSIDSSKGDGEAIAPPRGGQPTSDSASNPNDDTGQFSRNQERHHQQRQPRQRQPAGVSRRNSTFSLEGQQTGSQSF
ncbi:MAG: hypothetical protein ACK5UT_25135 [Acidobacteriota bacterium]|jgi:hypothetical protein